MDDADAVIDVDVASAAVDVAMHASSSAVKGVGQGCDVGLAADEAMLAEDTTADDTTTTSVEVASASGTISPPSLPRLPSLPVRAGRRRPPPMLELPWAEDVPSEDEARSLPPSSHSAAPPPSVCSAASSSRSRPSSMRHGGAAHAAWASGATPPAAVTHTSSLGGPADRPRRAAFDMYQQSYHQVSPLNAGYAGGRPTWPVDSSTSVPPTSRRRSADAAGEFEATRKLPSKLLSVGPLDVDRIGNNEIDASMVYVRLTNFAMRQRALTGLKQGHACTMSQCYDYVDTSQPQDALGGAMQNSDHEEATFNENWADRRRCLSVNSVQEEDEFSAPPRPRSRRPSMLVERSLTCPDVSEVDDVGQVDIGVISRHLETMNSAAADLNTAQQTFNQCVQERKSIIQFWAVGSARLARAAGAKRLAKATPYFERRRRCARAREAVSAASRRFMEAPTGSTNAAALDSEHARAVAEYQAAQHEFAKAASLSKETPSLVAAVQPYFDAEDAHFQQLAEADGAVSHLGRAVTNAKARYHAALRSLEMLSDHSHRVRGDASESPTVKPDAAYDSPGQVCSQISSSLMSRRGAHEDARPRSASGKSRRRRSKVHQLAHPRRRFNSICSNGSEANKSKAGKHDGADISATLSSSLSAAEEHEPIEIPVHP